jgi:hypothetical protein
VEKLRWAEKEWRELDDEVREGPEAASLSLPEEEEPEEPAQLLQIVRD